MKKKEIIKLYRLKNEDIKKLELFILELTKENLLTNLVGKSTLINPWDRHICDSIQIRNLIKNKNSRTLDMGTGAGFPGLVLSILGYKNITMIDSKIKKTKFVNKIIKKFCLQTKVVHTRLEDFKTKPFDYITSRALSSLEKLINYSLFFSNENTTLVFLKGRNVNNEIVEAKKYFFFDYKTFKSKSSGGGYIIRINNFIKK